MYELSLHVLDLMENSLRAGASVIVVSVIEDPGRDRLELVVEDNGPGLNTTPQGALNPFYTTKAGKRTGLGLSLFQAAAERAGGALELGPSILGGLKVAAHMQLGHVDRNPMGDLPATVATVALTNPELDLRVRLMSGETLTEVRLQDEAPGDAVKRSRIMAERVRKAAKNLRVTDNLFVSDPIGKEFRRDDT